jgi:predicted RNA-binding protein YlxR (DUF448 family)
VGCGRVAPKSELVRIVLDDAGGARARAVIDREAKMPGRGAYLCRAGEAPAAPPAAACAALAGRNRGLARALRAPVGIGSELIESVGR